MKADGEDKVERTDGCRGNDKMEEKKGGDGMNACREGRGQEENSIPGSLPLAGTLYLKVPEMGSDIGAHVGFEAEA